MWRSRVGAIPAHFTKIMITIEQLFAEDFKPVWMIRKEAAERQSFLDACSVDVEFKWRRTALRAVEHISEKHPPRQLLPTADKRKYLTR